jgi:hypothetical protein
VSAGSSLDRGETLVRLKQLAGLGQLSLSVALAPPIAFTACTQDGDLSPTAASTRPSVAASTNSSAAGPKSPANKSLQEARREGAASASALPSPSKGGEMRQYLEGDGAALVSALHQTGIDLLADRSRTAAHCQRLGHALQTALPANAAVDVIAGIPDEPTKALFLYERTAVGLTLTSCVTARAAQTPPPGEGADLEASVGAIDLRLDVLGIIR